MRRLFTGELYACQPILVMFENICGRFLRGGWTGMDRMYMRGLAGRIDWAGQEVRDGLANASG